MRHRQWFDLLRKYFFVKIFFYLFSKRFDLNYEKKTEYVTIIVTIQSEQKISVKIIDSRLTSNFQFQFERFPFQILYHRWKLLLESEFFLFNILLKYRKNRMCYNQKFLWGNGQLMQRSYSHLACPRIIIMRLMVSIVQNYTCFSFIYWNRFFFCRNYSWLYLV